MTGRTARLEGRARGPQLDRHQARERSQLEPLRRRRLGQSGAAELVAAGPAGSASAAQVLVDIGGAEAEALIPRIEAAIKSYQYANAGDYRIWPGPNSNTFVATVLRAVPELGVTMPPNAVGRDFRPLPYAGLSDSGTGDRGEPVGRARRQARLGRGDRGECSRIGRRPRSAPSGREAAGLRPHRRRWRGRDRGGEVITELSSRPSAESASRASATRYGERRGPCCDKAQNSV